MLCIGVDCDEVLSETINELLKRFPLKNKGIKKSDIISYDLYEVQKIGLSKVEAIQAFNGFFESPEYFQAKPVFGAYKKLHERKNAGHSLFVVTARNKPYEERTREWVNTNFPGIFSDFLFMNQYTENEIPKSQLCIEKGIQVLIDDNGNNIVDINGVGIPGFLLDKPRNQGIEDSNFLHRVYSRDEIDLDQFFKN